MMDFRVTSDTHWESRVGETGDALSDLKYGDFFEQREYGEGVLGITVTLMCRGLHTNFKQRVHFSKANKKLYMDIMLDFIEMRDATDAQRKKIVATRLYNEVPEIVAKYKKKITDFDADRFNADLQQWIKDTGWM